MGRALRDVFPGPPPSKPRTSHGSPPPPPPPTPSSTSPLPTGRPRWMRLPPGEDCQRSISPCLPTLGTIVIRTGGGAVISPWARQSMELFCKTKQNKTKQQQQQQRNTPRQTSPHFAQKQVMDQCVLPSMAYGCQTWSVNKQLTNKLRTAQRAMERKMLGLTKAI